MSRPEPRSDAQDMPNPRGPLGGDTEIANDLMRALGQIGSAGTFSQPSSEEPSPSEAKTPDEPTATVPDPDVRRPPFVGRIGTFATAYVAFVVLIGVGTYYLMGSGMHRYQPATPPVLAVAAPLTDRPGDQRPRAETGGTTREQQVPAPALSVVGASDRPAPIAQDRLAASHSEGQVLPAPAEPLLPVSTAEPAQVADVAPPLTPSTVPASEPVSNAIAVSAIETSTPARAEAPQPAASQPDTDEFVEQGRALLASGDITSARHFFEYAANRGNPAAARQVGETYDPMFLRHAAARGIAGDADKAAYWYLQAVEHGDPAAAEQLKRLLGR